MSCTLCPRRCGALRTGQGHSGFCGAGNEPEAAAVCLHTGEEPALTGGGRGMVNIFFAHCNMHCIYCQNGTISGHTVDPALIHYRGVEQIADAVCRLLPQSSGLVGFVTAAHYIDRLDDIARAIARRGFSPTYVYNSSGYESVESLRTVEGLIDIYLPDFKYSDSHLADTCSQAADYPEVAAAALREMMRQVGTGLKVDADGTAYRGLIVRHLVLPGHVGNSLGVLDRLAKLADSHSSATAMHLSLMAQYYPPTTGLPSPLDRQLTADEYAAVARRCDELGFAGWQQEINSQQCYRPDFSLTDNPFGHETQA